MKPLVVVVLNPFLDDVLRLELVHELFVGEAFFAEASVKPRHATSLTRLLDAVEYLNLLRAFESALHLQSPSVFFSSRFSTDYTSHSIEVVTLAAPRAATASRSSRSRTPPESRAPA